MPLRRYRTPQAEALKDPNGKRAIGKPPSFGPHIVEQTKRLCGKFGATDAQLADFLGVDVRTIYRWQLEHPEFCQAKRIGKEIADAHVERRFYEKATGYSHPAVKIFLRASDDKPVIVPYVEHIPPDTTAGIFWLKNRRPDLWRDRHEIDAAVVAVTANVEPLELAQRIAFLLLNGASVIEQGAPEQVLDAPLAED